MFFIDMSGPPVEYEPMTAGGVAILLVVMWLWVSWPIAMMIHHEGTVSARKAAWLGIAWPLFAVAIVVMGIAWLFGFYDGKKWSV